jgi:soluble lytic murein transglycosylase
LGFLLFLPALQAAADTPELRQSWLDARTAIRAGQADYPIERDLRRYALFPYLEADSILTRLRATEDFARAISDAANFLDEHEDTAIAESFRRELLLRFAELGEWQHLVDFYQPEVANVTRECQYLRARIELGETDGLAPLIVDRWLTPRRLDADCEPAFRWLRDNGQLDAALTGERLELLLAAGQTQFARIIASRLPDDEAEAYRQWATMLESPLDSLDRVADGALTPLHQAALPNVWSRTSTRDPIAAFERLSALLAVTEQLSLDDETLLRDLALGLAWDRREEALEVFAQMDASSHDDYSLGWLVRSALWNDAWPVADGALRSMSEAARTQSDWLYWHGRTAVELGETESGEAAYAALIERDNFYSALAAAHLERDVLPNDAPFTPADRLIDELAAQPDMIRARELFLAGERVAATREWRYATAGRSNTELAAAMSLASSWGWHDMAVATATRAEVFFDYRRLYPFPYAAEIADAAVAQNLNPALLGGLIRQESMFRPDAISSAGAIGLAQLGLSTARGTARTLGLPAPDRGDLFDPADNALLGAATLQARLERFDQQLPVALAAYNAGPAAAQRWLPKQPIAADIWIENIPYNETREYVRRVLWNRVVYQWLLTDEAPIDTGYLLGRIQAAPTAAPAR